MMVVTTVNGEDDAPVCLDACSDTWEEELFDNLGQEDQGKEQDDCHWRIFKFSLNLEAVYKMLCKWGILWTTYLLCRLPLQTDHSL